MLWNRTVNVRGGAGHCIEMDLVNEFLNNQFKENLKHSRGRYTESQIDRCALLVGPLGKAIDQVCLSQVADTHISGSGKRKLKHRTDIPKLVNGLNNDRLFDFIPGRCHATFPLFSYQPRIASPAKFKATMKKYSASLDREIAIMPDEL